MSCAMPASQALQTRAAKDDASEASPNRQRPRAPRDDRTRLGSSGAPEGQPAERMVSEANGGRAAGRAQDDDRRAGAQAPHRAMAARDNRRGAGRSPASPSSVTTTELLQPKRHRDARAADDRPRWRQPDVGLWPTRRGLEWARRLGASPPMRMTASWYRPLGRPNISSWRATRARWRAPLGIVAVVKTELNQRDTPAVADWGSLTLCSRPSRASRCAMAFGHP